MAYKWSLSCGLQHRGPGMLNNLCEVREDLRGVRKCGHLRTDLLDWVVFSGKVFEHSSTMVQRKLTIADLATCGLKILTTEGRKTTAAMVHAFEFLSMMSRRWRNAIGFQIHEIALGNVPHLAQLCMRAIYGFYFWNLDEDKRAKVQTKFPKKHYLCSLRIVQNGRKMFLAILSPKVIKSHSSVETSGTAYWRTSSEIVLLHLSC